MLKRFRWREATDFITVDVCRQCEQPGRKCGITSPGAEAPERLDEGVLGHIFSAMRVPAESIRKVHEWSLPACDNVGKCAGIAAKYAVYHGFIFERVVHGSGTGSMLRQTEQDGLWLRFLFPN